MIVVLPILFVVWLGFYGQFTWANVVGGLAAAALAAAIARPRPAGRHRINPIGVALLAVDLMKRLITSTWSVALTVIFETSERAATGIVVVPLTTSSSLVTTIVANGVTLTPGTLTLDAGWDAERGTCMLTIHVLGIGNPDDLRADVLALERTVLRAIRPVTGVAAARDRQGSSI
jgi:multicomponent Na+:H+ antiporter subunit E